MLNFEEKIFEAVKQIPRGRVATYGQIAELLGDKKLARAVGNVLHKNKNQFDVPCYRVVNAKGELSSAYAFGGASEQEKLLRSDGVEVANGKVDLIKYAWKQNNRDNS
ncbi:MAG: MGMT family protein [Synergistaceae bacterium]|nr:MGMT family protein [Synergistaceae bacterium]